MKQTKNYVSIDIDNSLFKTFDFHGTLSHRSKLCVENDYGIFEIIITVCQTFSVAPPRLLES